MNTGADRNRSSSTPGAVSGGVVERLRVGGADTDAQPFASHGGPMSALIPNRTERPLPERHILLALLVFGTTFEYRLQLSAMGITIMELFCYLALPVMFADLVGNPRAFGTSTSRLWQWNPYAQWYFVWTLFLSIFHIFASADPVILKTLKDLVPSWTLLWFLFLYCRSGSSVRTVILTLLLGGLINVVMGTAQGILGIPRPSPLSDASSAKMDIDGGIVGGLVATGWFSHPNAYALFLIPFAPLFVLVAMNRIKLGLFWRAVSISAIPVLGFAMGKSFGKGAMLWMFFAVMWSLIQWPKGRVRWHAMFWSTMVGISLVAGIATYLSEQYRSLETISVRTQLWAAATEALGTNAYYFFFGDAFERVLKLSYGYTGGHFPYPTAHNGVITQAVSYGVPGLLLFIAAFVRSTRSLLIPTRQKCLGADLEGVTAFVAAAIFGLLGEWFFEPASSGVVLPTQFFLLLGLAGVLASPAVLQPKPIGRK